MPQPGKCLVQRELAWLEGATLQCCGVVPGKRGARCRQAVPPYPGRDLPPGRALPACGEGSRGKWPRFGLGGRQEEKELQSPSHSLLRGSRRLAMGPQDLSPCHTIGL